MFVINNLSQERNGVLGVVLIQLLHVQIINEVDQKSFTFWSPSGTGFLLKWRKTELDLKDIGIGEVIEIDDVKEILSWVLVEIFKKTFDDLSLTTTSGTNQKTWFSGSDVVLHQLLESSGLWGWDSDGVHLLGSRIEGDGWDFPFSETDVVSIFLDIDIENSSDTWKLDISLEFLGPEIGEVLSVIDTIFDHQLTTEGPDTGEVELVLELSNLFSTVQDGF
jgi:hypothetical protein